MAETVEGGRPWWRYLRRMGRRWVIMSAGQGVLGLGRVTLAILDPSPVRWVVAAALPLLAPGYLLVGCLDARHVDREGRERP